MPSSLPPQDQTSDAAPNILPTTMTAFSNFKDSFLSLEANRPLTISGGLGSASASFGGGSAHSGSGNGGSGEVWPQPGLPLRQDLHPSGIYPLSSSAPDESPAPSSSGAVSDAPFSQSLATNSFAEPSPVAAYSSSNDSFSYGGYVQSPAIAEGYQVSSAITNNVPHSTNAATPDTNSRTATPSSVSSATNTNGASPRIDPNPLSFASSSAPSAVPEPSTLLLAAAGLASVLGNRKQNSLP